VSLVIGSLLLFQGAPPLFRVHSWLIATVVIVISSALAFIVYRALSIHRKQATTGREGLLGKTALVKVALNPSGTVFYKGERWTAVSESGEVKPGEEVIINRVDGLTLYVKKKQQVSTVK
jgi:membrane-bound serine protease (ClpP class)